MRDWVTESFWPQVAYLDLRRGLAKGVETTYYCEKAKVRSDGPHDEAVALAVDSGKENRRPNPVRGALLAHQGSQSAISFDHVAAYQTLDHSQGLADARQNPGRMC